MGGGGVALPCAPRVSTHEHAVGELGDDRPDAEVLGDLRRGAGENGGRGTGPERRERDEDVLQDLLPQAPVVRVAWVVWPVKRDSERVRLLQHRRDEIDRHLTPVLLQLVLAARLLARDDRAKRRRR